jgi:hypothetical protein
MTGIGEAARVRLRALAVKVATPKAGYVLEDVRPGAIVESPERQPLGIDLFAGAGGVLVPPGLLEATVRLVGGAASGGELSRRDLWEPGAATPRPPDQRATRPARPPRPAPLRCLPPRFGPTPADHDAAHGQRPFERFNVRASATSVASSSGATMTKLSIAQQRHEHRPTHSKLTDHVPTYPHLTPIEL